MQHDAVVACAVGKEASDNPKWQVRHRTRHVSSLTCARKQKNEEKQRWHAAVRLNVSAPQLAHVLFCSVQG